ncbi:MAG: ABC transporter substrate-binding protein [Anaerolineae bacterium]|nr:ABC transporter substrate-binding protein [Thermoflexales bacterium]MDW8408356.1 ABC transporter substrate-binding protein [Anaerolineae bacterium]
MEKMERHVGKALIVIMASAAVLASACATPRQPPAADSSVQPTPQAEVSQPTRLVMRTMTDPDNLDPHISAASLTQQIMLNVFEGLVKPAPDGSVVPGLAESYAVSADGLTYTFTLRSGARFHNGQPVTAADVQYSFDRLMGKRSPDGKPLTNSLADVERITTPNDATCVIKLKQVNASFVSLLSTLAILPASNDGQHDKMPIGTGPYRFVSYEPQQRIVLEKFADYWQDTRDMIDQIEFRIITDDQTALLQLQSGAIDFTNVSAEQLSTLGSAFKVVSHPANSVFILGMNHARPPFDALKVRQAIAHAVNKDAVIQAVFNGYAVKLGSNMSPVMARYYQDGLQDIYPYDPTRARALLAEAGYPNGFTTTLSISSHADLYGRTAQIVADQLAQAGIQLTIETVEWGVWLDRIYTNRDFDMTLIDFTGKIDPQAVLDRYTSEFRRNFINYKNPTYDQLIEQAVRAIDAATQIERYKQAQTVLAEDVAAVFLLDYEFHWAMKPQIQGYTPYPMFFHDLSRLRLAP